MISNGTPPILPPRCSLASSTERRMSSPMAACGPEKVLMKPILMGVCAMTGCRPKASAVIVAAPNNLLFMGCFPAHPCCLLGCHKSRKSRVQQHLLLPFAESAKGRCREAAEGSEARIGAHDPSVAV